MFSTILNLRSPVAFEIANKIIMVDGYSRSSSPLLIRSNSFWNCEQDHHGEWIFSIIIFIANKIQQLLKLRTKLSRWMDILDHHLQFYCKQWRSYFWSSAFWFARWMIIRVSSLSRFNFLYHLFMVFTFLYVKFRFVFWFCWLKNVLYLLSDLIIVVLIELDVLLLFFFTLSRFALVIYELLGGNQDYWVQ